MLQQKNKMRKAETDAKAPYRSARSAVRDGLSTFVFILVLAFVSIELQLPRIGERRLAFPIFLALCFFAVIARGRLSLNGTLVRSIWIPLFAYFLMLAWFATSILWSPAPYETVSHVIPLLAGVVLALLAYSVPPESTVTTLFKVGFWICILSWCLAIIAPQWGATTLIGWRLRGIMQHEFRLGSIASGILVCLTIMKVSLPKGKKLPHSFVLVGVISGITLLGTQTRTLTAYTVFTILLVVSIHGSRKWRLTSIIIALSSLVIFLLFNDELTQFLSRGDSDYTLTGRTIIWERSIAATQGAPWIGHGFATFLEPVFDSLWGIYRPPHAHNAWVQTYFETGYVGVGLMTMVRLVFFWSAIRSQKRLKRPSYALYLTLLATLYDLTGLMIGNKMTTYYGLILVLLVQEAWQARLASKCREQKLTYTHSAQPEKNSAMA